MSKLNPEIYVDKLWKDLTTMSEVVPSGSYFISNTKGTDIDFFVNGCSRVYGYLTGQGFVTGFEGADASFENDAKFISYKKGIINVICVRSKQDLQKIRLATDLCIALKLKTKSERLYVFNTLRLGIVSDRKSTELE